MDREAAQKKMQALYKKARDARREGKRDIAKSFRAGGNRLQRQLRASAPKPAKKKGKDAG